MVDFSPPLTKGKAAEIMIEYEAEALPGHSLPDFWYFVTESRTDMLSLRVVFDQSPTTPPRFRICDQAGTAVAQESLPVDPVSLECSKHLLNIRPGMRYIIDWEPSKAQRGAA
jgi:hypothetical protein